MQLLIVHPAEPDPRAPLTPAVAKAWISKGLSVSVQSGVGLHAGSDDDAWADAGCEVVAHDTNGPAWGAADVVACVAAPPVEAIGAMKRGAVLVGMLGSAQDRAVTQACLDAGVSAIDLAFLPRTSRAQAMDVLSSQANLAGYKAAVLAASHLPKLMPMMITAAGTLRPSKVFVLGVGVAGLQAIATAKRLGAQVEAFDVRAATKEQVESLGARFVEIDLGPGDDDASTAGGYAKELTDAQKQKQAEGMHRLMVAADAVIATAAVFGKAPPLLIPQETVDAMPAGSVIVDLAASPAHGRGNCAATRPGETYTIDNGPTIVGTLNLPATVPTHATQAFAGNIDHLLKDLVTPAVEAREAKDGKLAVEAAPASLHLDLSDELFDGAAVIHNGEARHELVKAALA
ncbi:MAG: NAD(P)(+) transhydrogenase (Re/Si-specific) subunit alpha [Planctomycetota bacterium]